MVEHALGAGQHAVVVGHDHAARRVVGKNIAVDPPQAADHAVTRCLAYKIIHLAAAALGRYHQRAVLFEGPRIAEIVHVLTGRTLPGLATTRDHVGAVFVQPEGVPVDDLGEIGPHAFKIGSLFGHRLCHFGLRFFYEQQALSLGHRVTGSHIDHQQFTRHWSRDHVLHLHRLHHQQLVAGGQNLSDLDGQRNHRARHGRAQDPLARVGDYSALSRQRRYSVVLEKQEPVPAFAVGRKLTAVVAQ